MKNLLQQLNRPVHLNYYRFSLVVGLLIMAYESLTKGWASLLLVPLLLLLIIVFAALAIPLVRRSHRGTLVLHTKALAWALLIAVTIFYICVPSFGDTEDVLLFGFYLTSIHTVATAISVLVAYCSFTIAAVALVALIVSLVVSRHAKPLVQV